MSQTMVLKPTMTVLILGVLLICLPHFTLAQNPPDLASEVTISSITTTTAIASWTRTTGDFDSYEVTIIPLGGVIFTPASVPQSSTSPATTISGLTVGTPYTITVRTLKGTNKGTAKTKSFNTQPAAVSQPSINIQAGTLTTTTATLTWGAVNTGDFNNYHFSITPPHPGGAVMIPATVSKGTETAALTNLAPGTEYNITVRTKYGTVESAAVTFKFKTIPSQVVLATVNIASRTSTSATLTWGPVATGTFDNYLLTISPTAGGATVSPSTVPRGTETANLQSLTPGTDYTVTMKTQYVPGTSASIQYQFQTLPGDVVATSIKVVNGTLTSTSATISWDAVTMGSFDNYTLTLQPTGGAKVDINPIAKGVQTFDFNGLTVGTQYTVVIKTAWGALESTGSTFQFNTVPNAITEANIVFSLVEAASAQVTWGAAAGAFDDYMVRIRPTIGGAKPETNPVPKGTHSTNLVSLTAGTEYTVTITTSAGGVESTPASKKFWTKPAFVSRDTILIPTFTSNSATMTWTAVSVGTFENYVITISPSNSGEIAAPNPVPKGTETTELKNLLAGTAYTITIKTTHKGQESVTANFTFTTKPNSIDPARITFTNIQTRSATVTWQAATGTFGDYIIRITPLINGAKAVPAIVSKGIHSTSLTSLTAGTAFTITIRARVGTTESDGASQVLKTKPVGVSKQTIKVTTVTAISATLTWSPVSTGTVDRYLIGLSPTTGRAEAFPNSVNTGTTTTNLIRLTAGELYTVTITTEYGNQTGDVTTFTFYTLPPNLASVTVSAITTTTATVTWPKTEGNFDSYRITISPDTDGEKVDTPTVLKSEASLQTTLSSLRPGQAYTVRVSTLLGTTLGVAASKTFNTMECQTGFFREPGAAKCSECHCIGTCYPTAGCTDSACSKGFRTTPQCQEPCPEGLFGFGCQNTCHCKPSDTCSHISGTCPKGCHPDYWGADCQMLLPGLNQAPTLSGISCSNVTVEWLAFDTTRGDTSSFPVISGYLLQNSVNGTWSDMSSSIAHEANKTYSYLESGLKQYTKYKFRVRTDANLTIAFPGTVSYAAIPGRPSPETAVLIPPCFPVVTTPTTTTPTTTTLTTTTLAPGAPSIPVNLIVTPSSSTEIVVNWEPPTSSDHTDYTLSYGLIVNGDCPAVAPADYKETNVPLTANIKSHTLSGLEPWSLYKISLRAKNLIGTGPAAIASTRTREAAPTGKCSNLRASDILVSSFMLSFDPPPCETRNGALSKYTVRATDPASGQIVNSEVNIAQASYNLTGLTPNTNYQVVVAFLNSVPQSTPLYSNPVAVKMAKWTILTTARPGSVDLNWQPLYPKPNEVLGAYIVTYWVDTPGSENTTTSTSQTSYSVTGLPNGIFKFQVSVQSTITWKSVVTSEVATVNTGKTAPGPPTSLSLSSKTESGITIAWSEPTGSTSNLISYRVVYKFTRTGLPSGESALINATGIKTVLASEKMMILSPLDPATTYQISVSARNANGLGDPLVETFSTRPGTPNDPAPPTVADSNSTSITLTLKRPTSTTGPITKMSIMVEKNTSSKRRRRAVTALCTKAAAVELKPSDYTGADNTATVVLGNGPSGSANAPLDPGTKYDLCYKVTSTYEGISTIAGTTLSAETKAKSDTTVIIIIVVVLLLIIIIIIVIVVVVIILKRKRNRMSKSLWRSGDTMNLEQFDDTMYNIRPYGRWSDVHKIGEPRSIELVKDPLDADPNIIPIEDEYHKLPQEILYTWEHAMAPDNLHRNRFETFLPYDHSRVVLQHGKNDYVNANYIDGYKKPRAYIAAQSPFNAETVADFWQMVCQENTLQIVMLTLPVEDGVFKCEQYWPDSTHTYAGIRVKLLSTEKYAYFCIRTFEVVPNPHTKMTVTQCQFTGWPLHGIPEDPIPFLDFIYKFRSLAQPGAGPVVVHCGTGVSRTSVFIAVDSLIKEGRKRGKVNVFDFCSEMRQNRFGMVRTPKQYLFIYDMLYEALLTPDSILDIDMRTGYHALISKNPSTGHTNLYEQFKIFHDFTPLVDETKCRRGLDPANKRKNRFPNIVPPDEFRPTLKTPGGHGRTDYINALILDSYTRKDAFIVTQTPLAETVVDFWKLVYDYKISTIVMLHDRTYKEESSAEYWPKTLGSVRYDPFVVTLRTFVKEREYVISRTMDVNNQIRPSEKAHEVKQFQLDGDWLMYDHVPKSRECVLQLIDAVFENRKKSADHPETPILVHCIDGAERSGLFVCLMNLVERMQIDRYADVFHCMKHIKRKRSQFVDDLDQYRFCYKALWDFINTRMVQLPASVPRNAMNGMNGTANGTAEKRSNKRHLELTLAANDLNNYDYTLSLA